MYNQKNQTHHTRFIIAAAAILITVIGWSSFNHTAGAESSATNGKIAFVRSVNGTPKIFTANPDGGGEQCLMCSPDGLDSRIGEQPAFSPNGQTIAFHRLGEIWLMNANGSNQRRIPTPEQGTEGFSPAWNPDGTRLVFSRSSQFGIDVWVMNADGSGQPKQLTTGELDESPAWGVNNLIAFERTIFGDTSHRDIFVMNPDGGGLTNITTNSTANDRKPAWSLDATRIAFHSDRGTAPRSDIYTMNPFGGEVQRLTNAGYDNQDPTYSPDGNLITFESGSRPEASSNRIFVMNKDGSVQRPVTASGVTERDPSWGSGSQTSPTPTPVASYSIGGFVEDVNASLISGARLNLTGDTNGDGTSDITRTATTGSGFAAGYNFDNLPAGAYTVAVSVDNRVFDPNTRAVTLPTSASGGNASITFRATRITTGCVTARPSLVHWYRAEGNFNDSASRVNASSTGTEFTPGKVGQAFRFNGTSASVVSNQTSALNAIPVSIEAWVKPALRNDGTDFPTNAVGNDNGSHGQGFGLNVWQGGSQLKVEYSDGFRVIPGVSFVAETWYHIVVAYRNGNVRTSVNGVQVDDFSFTQGSLNGANNILIGKHNDNATEGTRRFFKGLIDEVSIYTRRLTDDNIEDLYNADGTGKCFVSPPSNDDIQNAQTISGALGLALGKNVGATRQTGNFFPEVGEPDEPLHNYDVGGRSVWYKFTAPSLGTLTLDTNNSDFDTLLAVYQVRQFGDILLFLPLDSNDNYAKGYKESRVVIPTEPNAIYYVAVDGYKGVTGNVGLRHVYEEFKPSPPSAEITEIYAGSLNGAQAARSATTNAPIACTNDSDPAGICAENFDAGGFFVVTLKGQNFQNNSRIIYNGDELKGFDRNGQPVNGYTFFVSSTQLEAHIPPSPPLDLAKDGALQVITPVSSGAISNTTKLSPESIRAGEYQLAANAGVLNVIELRNAVIPPGQTREVCGNTPFNKPDEEICINFTAFGGNNESLTITPSFFNSEIANQACRSLTNSDGFNGDPTENADYAACVGLTDGKQLSERSYSINSPNFFNTTGNGGKVIVRTRLAVPTNLRPSIANGQTLPTVLVQGGRGVQLLGQDGAGIISGGGGNIISGGAGNIISGGAGNIISGGAGNIISGGAGNIISGGAGNRPQFLSSLSRPTRDPADGLVGNVVARGSGGSAPVIIVTEDPETGEPIYTAEITLDETSNPRIQDVQGLAFTFALDAPVIQLAATTVTVNEAAGQATVIVTRTGDTSGVSLVNYATSDGTASAGSDYAATEGRLTFGPGETSKTFNVPILTDGLNESNENFLVSLTAVAHAALDVRQMQVTITNAAAVPRFQVSGRVTTPDGRGMPNALVGIIDANGIRRTVTTSSFGHYVFNDVVSGRIYTVGVLSRRFKFTSRTIEVTDTIANVDFVGRE